MWRAPGRVEVIARSTRFSLFAYFALFCMFARFVMFVSFTICSVCLICILPWSNNNGFDCFASIMSCLDDVKGPATMALINLSVSHPWCPSFDSVTPFFHSTTEFLSLDHRSRRGVARFQSLQRHCLNNDIRGKLWPEISRHLETRTMGT